MVNTLEAQRRTEASFLIINLKAEPRASSRDTGVPWRCISMDDVGRVVYPGWVGWVYIPGCTVPTMVVGIYPG